MAAMRHQPFTETLGCTPATVVAMAVVAALMEPVVVATAQAAVAQEAILAPEAQEAVPAPMLAATVQAEPQVVALRLTKVFLAVAQVAAA